MQQVKRPHVVSPGQTVPIDGRDPSVARRLAAFCGWQAQFRSLMDASIHADHAERFETVVTLVEANMILARHRLETVPPENSAGMALLLRYGLSITDDPRLAAVMKSCLVALLGRPETVAMGEIDQIPDEAFDEAVDWPGSSDRVEPSGPPLS